MAHLGAFKNMFEEIADGGAGGCTQPEDEAMGRADSGFVGLDNQGATCYLNALLQAMYMTPELRHGLYSINPKEIGEEAYEQDALKDKNKEKAKLAKERAKIRKQEAEGKVQPDPEIVKQLLAMFPLQAARRAALKTDNESFEAALDWALAHSEDDDFNAPLPGEDEEEEADDDDSDTGAEANQKGKGKKGGKKPPTAKWIPLELQRLFSRLQLLDTRTDSTERLTTKGFKWQDDQGRVQHDAHELNRLLIDKLERSLRKSKTNSGLVSALYEGVLVNQVKCLKCDHVSERKETFRDVLLQVAGQEDLVTSLLSYTRPERLAGDNKYFCDQCQSKQDALRSQTLRALPPVLIFSLNRFEFDFETLERVKVQTPFRYPVALDMEPFVEGRAWAGNDNSDESQIPDLAGDPDTPGTCRNRQKWIPQAWRDAEIDAEDVYKRSLSNDERAAAASMDEVLMLRKGGGAVGGEERGAEGVRQAEEQESGGLVYDLLAVVVHRGSAYSGHYHAFIKDSLQEGRWVPPSGFELSEVEAAATAALVQEEPTDGATSVKNTSSAKGKRKGGASHNRSSSDAAGKGKKGNSHSDPKALLVSILKERPKHEDLQLPYMKLSALRTEIKKRSGGNQWNKVFAATHGKLEQFLEAHGETFLLQSETPAAPAEVLLMAGDDDSDSPGAGAGKAGGDSGKGEDEMEKALRLSLEQSQREKGVAGGEMGGAGPEGGKAGGMKVKKGALVSKGTIDALAAEKHGRWFSFDDRKVTPISILDLQKPFSGAETAYLLVYRARSLDQESSSLCPSTNVATAPPTSSAALLSGAASLTTSAAAAAAAASSNGKTSGALALPGNLHMTSEPPDYWIGKVAMENVSLRSAKTSREANVHALTLKVWLPSLLTPEPPHLIPLSPGCEAVQKLPETLRGPVILHMDDRQTISDLKKAAVARVGKHFKEMGCPDGVGRVRLSEVTAHGPGLFISKHLPDAVPRFSHKAARRKGGAGGDDDRPPPMSPVLGDLEWDDMRDQEVMVLMWDGYAVDGVELDEPTPENRPIRLTVSVLKPADEEDPDAWIDAVLQQAGTTGLTPERRGGRAEVRRCAVWQDVYVRAGVTTQELMRVVSDRGGGGVNAAKMCISVLRPPTSGSDVDGVGSTKRRGAGGGEGGRESLEAVQIAGPEGVFQEWKNAKQAAGSRSSGSVGSAGDGGGGMDASLELREGSELLVEEQGAVSKLIMVESTSLADMEAARRNRLVQLEVEVDDVVIETVKKAVLGLAHDHAVDHHAGRSVIIHLEVDGESTTVPHVKARCLLNLAPGLMSLPASALDIPQLPAPIGTTSTASAATASLEGQLALARMVSSVRLSGNDMGTSSSVLDEAVESGGMNLQAAKIRSGSSFMLEWGAPLATGKSRVKFQFVTGNNPASMYDASRPGSVVCTLSVEADLKEPVSALKARMLEAAREYGAMVDDQERRIRLGNLIGDSTTLVEEEKDAEQYQKTSPPQTSTGRGIKPSVEDGGSRREEKDQRERGKGSRRDSGGGSGKGRNKMAGSKGDATNTNGAGTRSLSEPKAGGEHETTGTTPSGGKDDDDEAAAKVDDDGEAATGGVGVSKSKKRRKKKKAGAGASGGTVKGADDKDETPEASKATTDPAGVTEEAEEAVARSRGDEAKQKEEGFALCDRLVEESGILQADEIRLEEGRVPRPRELEIVVQAYAPHFVGFAAAATNEEVGKERAARPKRAKSPTDDCPGSPGTSSDTSAALDHDLLSGGGLGRGSWLLERSGVGGGSGREARRGRKEGAFVPTGLSPDAVWPNDEEEKMLQELEREKANPQKVLMVKRRMCLRNLGRIYLDERKSLTELRAILRKLLEEALRKATQQVTLDAVRATEAAAQAARAAQAENVKALGPTADDDDVMQEDEIEKIRKSIKIKSGNKPRKKRRAAALAAAAAASTSSSTGTTDNPKTDGLPSPSPDNTPSDPVSFPTINGHPPSSLAEGTSASVAPSHEVTCNGARKGLRVKECVSAERAGERGGGDVVLERAHEVQVEFADSDDEIPLPEGMPAFRDLEEAMLVRDLKKDRLPGRIIRGRDGSDTTAGGLFVSQPISELRLASSSALVLCLRPRLPQCPLDTASAQEAKERRGREKLAREMLENGQAKLGGGRDSRLGSAAGSAVGGGGGAAKEEWEKLSAAVKTLEALEANLSDLVAKRHFREDALEESAKTCERQSKAAKNAEHESSVRSWEKQIKAEKDQINNIKQNEEIPLELEVKALRHSVAIKRKRLKEKTRDQPHQQKQEQLQQPQQPQSAKQDESSPAEAESLFTRVRGVMFSTAKATLGFVRGTEVESSKEQDSDTEIAMIEDVTEGKADSSECGRDGDKGDKEKDKDKGKGKDKPSDEEKKDEWGTLGNQTAKSGKGGKGGKGGGKKSTNANSAVNNGSTAASDKTATTTAAAAARASNDELKSRRTDPTTDLHLWTFRRTNPLGDGGRLPSDEPEWPGPLKEVIVENTSQPTLENLYDALGKAYGLPSSRVWAIKNNWLKHEWVRLTPEMGLKKMKKKSHKKKGVGGDGRRQVTNLRDAPYSLKDGDVVGVVDREEDPMGQADLTRAEDEAYREQEKALPHKSGGPKRRRNKKASPNRSAPEIGLTLGSGDDDSSDEDEDDDDDDDWDDDDDDLTDIAR